MNILERASAAIRHAPGLEHADWLWDRIRPAYDRMLATIARGRGLERVVNGTDRFRLSPPSRGFVAQEYEPAVWSRVMREVRTRDQVVEVHPFAWAEAGTTSASFLGLLDELGFRAEDMKAPRFRPSANTGT